MPYENEIRTALAWITQFSGTWYGQITIRILAVAALGWVVGVFIKKIFDIFGFYSRAQKKELLHLIAEVISYLANIAISFLLFKIDLLNIGINENVMAYATICGIAAMGVQIVLTDKRSGQLLAFVYGKIWGKRK